MATAAPSLTVNGVTVPGVAPAFRLLTASYTLPLADRITFYADGFKNVGTDRSFGATAGIAISFGARTTASVAGGYDAPTGLTGITRLDANAVTPGQFGVHLYDQQGPMQRLAEAEYLGSWGRVSAGVAEVPGQAAGQAELSGAVGVLAGTWPFLSRNITDSFALVSTAPLGGIGVLDENQPAGRTDAAGTLVVPDLNAYQPNRIGLAPTDLPADVTTRMMGTDVTPASHVGVLVDFHAARSKAALLTLVDAAGRDLPVGAEAQLAATGETEEVGYGGQTYLTDLAAENRLQVRLPGGGSCTATFAFVPTPGRLAHIGPVACR
jgi:outer membrane usher protein